jgi:hypothetical protein
VSKDPRFADVVYRIEADSFAQHQLWADYSADSNTADVMEQ